VRLSDWIRKIENRLFRKKGFTEINREVDEHVEALRRRGVRIGRDCKILTSSFSTEPYLIDIGDRVAVSGGAQFITHDASAWLIRRDRPDAQVLGRIRVGDDTFIGENCMILPGATIGSGCVIAAGSVVRGRIPDNSLVIGNPGRVVGRASLLKASQVRSGRVLDTLRLPEREREAAIRRHFGV
jgi:acetyltransferase-like isoleucine patch superfamily enzyme